MMLCVSVYRGCVVALCRRLHSWVGPKQSVFCAQSTSITSLNRSVKSAETLEISRKPETESAPLSPRNSPVPSEGFIPNRKLGTGMLFEAAKSPLERVSECLKELRTKEVCEAGWYLL